MKRFLMFYGKRYEDREFIFSFNNKWELMKGMKKYHYYFDNFYSDVFILDIKKEDKECIILNNVDIKYTRSYKKFLVDFIHHYLDKEEDEFLDSIEDLGDLNTIFSKHVNYFFIEND